MVSISTASAKVIVTFSSASNVPLPSVSITVVARKDAAPGATKSVVSVSASETSLTFPAASVCVAVNSLLSFSARSVPATSIDQKPSALTTADLSLVSNPLTVTVAPASPVPVSLNPTECSLRLIKLPPEAASIVGASGANKSVVSVSVEPRDTFPAKSVCVAVNSLLPSSARSVPSTTTDQKPSESTVVVLSSDTNPLTVTVAPASPVPVSVNPSVYLS